LFLAATGKELKDDLAPREAEPLQPGSNWERIESFDFTEHSDHVSLGSNWERIESKYGELEGWKAISFWVYGARSNWERIERLVDRHQVHPTVHRQLHTKAATGKELKAIKVLEALGIEYEPPAATGKELKGPVRHRAGAELHRLAATGKELKGSSSCRRSVRRSSPVAATGKELKGEFPTTPSAARCISSPQQLGKN
jgi:hypothetical protein